jgi:hypothetical protein
LDTADSGRGEVEVAPKTEDGAVGGVWVGWDVSFAYRFGGNEADMLKCVYCEYFAVGACASFRAYQGSHEYVLSLNSTTRIADRLIRIRHFCTHLVDHRAQCRHYLRFSASHEAALRTLHTGNRLRSTHIREGRCEAIQRPDWVGISA